MPLNLFSTTEKKARPPSEPAFQDPGHDRPSTTPQPGSQDSSAAVDKENSPPGTGSAQDGESGKFTSGHYEGELSSDSSASFPPDGAGSISPESFLSLRDLKEIVISVWEDSLLGIDISTLGTGLAILFLFLFLRGLFSRYVLERLKQWSAASKTKADDQVLDALIPPLQFVPILLGVYFSFRYIGLDDAMGHIFTNLMKSLVAFTIFWGFFRALLPLSSGFYKLDRLLSPGMAGWLFKSLRIAVLCLGATVILEIWGIEVGPLLAGLGLFGVAVALGAQDFFKNMIAGASLIAEKRFEPGDWIKVDNVVEGTVEDIGIRSTQIRRFDKAPVHVPNSQLSDTAITNFSRMTNRRIYWIIGVEYRTSTDQLKVIRDGLMSYIHTHEAFEKKGVPTFVHIDSFGASSIDIMLYCFTKTTKWEEWLKIKEELAFRVKEIVEEKAGAAFAFPSQSVYMESLPESIFAQPPGTTPSRDFDQPSSEKLDTVSSTKTRRSKTEAGLSLPRNNSQPEAAERFCPPSGDRADASSYKASTTGEKRTPKEPGKKD